MAKEHKRRIMDSQGIELSLRRMAQQILEANKGAANLALVGIADGGVPVTHRLSALLCEHAKCDVPVGFIDITLYRDDLTINDQPELKSTKIDFDIDGMRIILVDDVVFTGRTVRAAITALMDYGRPGLIQLAALVDRGHRELPIQPDFVGRHMDTDKDQKVTVGVSDEAGDKKDKVVLITPINNEEE